MHHGLAGCALALGALGTPAAAQGFNLDCGTSFGLPSAGYGAAAGQPGFWNAHPGSTTNPFPLRDLEGAPTDARLHMTLPFGAAFFPHPGIQGDDRALLCDYFDLASIPHAFVITGLEPGIYDLYFYGWAPDNQFFQTLVSLDGESSVSLSGPWPGALTKDVTHGIFRILVAPEDEVSIHTFGILNGTLNGMQLVLRQEFLSLALEGDAPPALPAGRETKLTVRIAPNDEVLARPPHLVWRFEGSPEPFQREPLMHIGGELWSGKLPAGACGQIVEYFVSTVGSASGWRTLPHGAPGQLLRAPVGKPVVEPRLAADFEAGLPAGWSADGLWHVTTECAPEPSCDGGTFAYYGVDGQCDYDSGAQNQGILRTPPIDLVTELDNARAVLRFCFVKEGVNEFLGAASVWANGKHLAEIPHQPDLWAQGELDVSELLGELATIEFRFESNHPSASFERGLLLDGVSVVVEGTVCGDGYAGLLGSGDTADVLLK